MLNKVEDQYKVICYQLLDLQKWLTYEGKSVYSAITSFTLETEPNDSVNFLIRGSDKLLTGNTFGLDGNWAKRLIGSIWLPQDGLSPESK